MAIEIIGENEGIKKQCTCRKCGAVLSYLPIDVVKTQHKDYSGSTDDYYWLTCPRCNDKFEVSNPANRSK